MKIDIERLGLKNVAVDPDTLFSFPAGVAGFEECKRFKLFHEEGKNTVFWLQSVDDASVMFPVVSPEALDIEYQIELGDEDCALIDMKDSDDVAVVVIVRRPSLADLGCGAPGIAARRSGVPSGAAAT